MVIIKSLFAYKEIKLIRLLDGKGQKNGLLRVKSYAGHTGPDTEKAGINGADHDDAAHVRHNDLHSLYLHLEAPAEKAKRASEYAGRHVKRR